jgi:tetratricopeptide (TPR) repeat protein
MRGAWIAGLALLLGTVSARPAAAGVYSPSEPWVGPQALPDAFLSSRASIRGAAVELPNRLTAACWTVTTEALPGFPGLPLRLVPTLMMQAALLPEGRSYGWTVLERVGRLEAKSRQGTLSLDERIDLGAAYLRQTQYRKAIELLEPAARQQSHFMLLANLATAYELEGVLERAVSYRRLAVASWPSTYPGWQSNELSFALRAEKAHLHLTQLRLQEAQRGLGRGPEGLDALYPQVRFVGASGEYEAGRIAPAQLAELPYDARDVVMQLVLWLPFDDRLYWLLGEIFNAHNEMTAAFRVFQELVEARRTDPRSLGSGASPELRRHYLVLRPAVQAAQALEQRSLAEGDPFLMLRYSFAVQPRGISGVPVAGDLAAAVELPATLLAAAERARGGRPTPTNGAPTIAGPTAPPTPAPTAVSDWMPQWRQIGVGFAAGALVAFLVGQQLRQLRRRAPG